MSRDCVQSTREKAQRKDWPADRNVFDGNQDPPAIHYLIFCLRSISPSYISSPTHGGKLSIVPLQLTFSRLWCGWPTDGPTDGQEEYIKIKVAARNKTLCRLLVQNANRPETYIMITDHWSEFKPNKDQSTYKIHSGRNLTTLTWLAYK